MKTVPIKTLQWFLWTTVLALSANAARGDTSSSYAGTLADPNSTFEVSLTLTATSDVTLQTYGFGGGTNQMGTVISPGGTDPFVGLFSGTGDSATFIDGTSLDLSNYSSGCPPASTVSNFGGTTCGDVTLQFDGLAVGDYTVLLSDGQYVPNAAVGAGTTLGDGLFDATGGAFCNIADFTGSVETDCPNASGAYALDVISTAPSGGNGGGTPPVPEPASLLMLAAGLAGVFGVRKQRKLAQRTYDGART